MPHLPLPPYMPQFFSLLSYSRRLIIQFSPLFPSASPYFPKAPSAHFPKTRDPLSIFIPTQYRVSINSFPNYKLFLQENYLDMLELYVAPQLEEFQPWIIFIQDGAPPH